MLPVSISRAPLGWGLYQRGVHTWKRKPDREGRGDSDVPAEAGETH